VEVISTQSGESINLASIDGATMARVIVAFAAGESRKISVRVLRQQVDERKAGRHHGATRPLGYERKTRKDGTVAFVPKWSEVALIRKAMRSVIAGKSLADIAHEWTKQGVTHPAHSRSAGKDADVTVYPWSPTSIGHILHSHRNLGRLTNREGEDVGQGSWRAIVDRELFDQCNATIAQRRKRGTASPTRRRSLTGLMFCGGCGAKMTRGRSAKTEYYRCPGSSKDETYPCGKVGIVAPFIEDLVLAAVVERLSAHDFKLDDDQPDHSPRLAAIAARLDAIDATIRDAAKRTATAGRASLRALMLVTEQLDQEQSELIAERDALLAVSPSVAYHGNADRLLEEWRSGALTDDQRHEIVAAVLRRITIAPIGRGKWPAAKMAQRVTFG
jgi:site-specific DNA recombinase